MKMSVASLVKGVVENQQNCTVHEHKVRKGLKWGMRAHSLSASEALFQSYREHLCSQYSAKGTQPCAG